MRPFEIVMPSLVVAALCGGTLAFAQEKEPKKAPSESAAAAKAGPEAAPSAAAPAPPPELDELYKPFAGTLKCDTKFAAGAMGPGSPETTVKSTVRIKKDLDGFWYRGEYEVKKTKTQPGMRGVFYLGYDPTTKQALITGVDSAGGASWGTGTKQGEAIVFEEQAFTMGAKVKLRETLTKNDAGISHKVEIDAGKGFGFQPMFEESCTK